MIGTYKMTMPSNRHSVPITGAGRPAQALSKTKTHGFLSPLSSIKKRQEAESRRKTEKKSLCLAG